MKKCFWLLLPLLLTQSTLSAAIPDWTARGGLPNVARKLQQGGEVRVAYFGGSITEQKGWRIQSLNYLRKQFPQAQLSEINAAIGGTGSDLGVLRVDDDVIRHHPDLVFIEFAVNDGDRKPEEIEKNIEGILRKLRRALPQTDLCFVYTVTASTLPAYQAGQLPRAAATMEKIADYYRIPSICMANEIARQEKNGNLAMKAPGGSVVVVSGDTLDENSPLLQTADGKIPFSYDGVHPFPNTGHLLYTRVLCNALPVLFRTGQAGPIPLPAPMRNDCRENSRAYPLDAPGIRLTGEFSKLESPDPFARRFSQRLPTIWRLLPGATLEFRFRGTQAMLYDCLGPDGAIVRIEVDGKTGKSRRFDAYSTYPRLALLPLGGNLADGEHRIKITVLDEPIDKRAILFENRRTEFDRQPENYAPLRYSVGKLFLIGELL